MADEAKDLDFSTKQTWVREQMLARISEFSEEAKLNVFCGTWNVNDKPLKNESTPQDTGSPVCRQLLDWILPTDTQIADIYAIGLQEIVDLNAVNTVISNQKSVDRVLYWQQMFAESFLLPEFNGIEYSLVCTRHLVGIVLFVFTKNSLLPSISNIRGAICPTGAMGLMGNKGGVAVRFDINLSSVCFVCSHFHAHRDQVQLRNADFKTILDKISFVHDTTASVKPHLLRKWWYDIPADEKLSISDHDAVFWIGDLNYRIDGSVGIDEIFTMLEQQEWRTLIYKDQLVIERSSQNVFQGFSEGQLNFPPTYKYQPGTDHYDRRPDKKLRAPAWCDRILFRVFRGPENSLQQMSYRKSNLCPSDHKPVSSSFEWDTRISIQNKERSIYQELLVVIDRWENLTAPKLELDNCMLEFGNIDVISQKSMRVIISNTGGVFAKWSFVPTLDETRMCKDWVQIKPSTGVLAPSESTEIVISLALDATTSLSWEGPSDPSSTMALEDILILHVANGSDFFIIINAAVTYETYQKLTNLITQSSFDDNDIDIGDVYLKPSDNDSPISSENKVVFPSPSSKQNSSLQSSFKRLSTIF